MIFLPVVTSALLISFDTKKTSTWIYRYTKAEWVLFVWCMCAKVWFRYVLLISKQVKQNSYKSTSRRRLMEYLQWIITAQNQKMNKTDLVIQAHSASITSVILCAIICIYSVHKYRQCEAVSSIYWTNIWLLIGQIFVYRVNITHFKEVVHWLSWNSNLLGSTYTEIWQVSEGMTKSSEKHEEKHLCQF